jgi:hypothetical protein
MKQKTNQRKRKNQKKVTAFSCESQGIIIVSIKLIDSPKKSKNSNFFP